MATLKKFHLFYEWSAKFGTASPCPLAIFLEWAEFRATRTSLTPTQPFKQHNFLRYGTKWTLWKEYERKCTKKKTIDVFSHHIYIGNIKLLKKLKLFFSVLDMDWVINYLNILTNLNNLFIDMIYIRCDNIVLVGIT